MGNVINMFAVALVVILFAAINSQVITVRLFFWQVDSPLVLIIAVAFAIGFVVGAMQLIPGFWKHRAKSKESSKALSALEKERDSLKEHSVALESKVHQLSSKDDSSST